MAFQDWTFTLKKIQTDVCTTGNELSYCMSKKMPVSSPRQPFLILKRSFLTKQDGEKESFGRKISECMSEKQAGEGKEVEHIKTHRALLWNTSAYISTEKCHKDYRQLYGLRNCLRMGYNLNIQLGYNSGGQPLLKTALEINFILT